MALLSGSVIASPAIRVAIRRASSTAEIRTYLSVAAKLQVLEPISAGVVLASGIYLASVGRFRTFGWVQVAAALWVVNSALAVAVVKPLMGRLAAEAAAERDNSPGERLNSLRWSRRWTFAGDLLMANDAATLYLMTTKPGLTGSILVVVSANLLVAAARTLGWGGGRGDRSGAVANRVHSEVTTNTSGIVTTNSGS